MFSSTDNVDHKLHPLLVPIPCCVPFNIYGNNCFGYLKIEILTEILANVRDADGENLKVVNKEIFPGEEESEFLMYLEKAVLGGSLTFLLRFERVEGTLQFKVAVPFKIQLNSAGMPPLDSIHPAWWHTIRHFYMDSCHNVDHESMLFLASNLSPSACVVQMAGSHPRVNDDVVSALVQRCGASLLCLSLQGSDISDHGVALIAASTPKLKYLGLNRCENLTYRSYQAIYDGCPELTEIDCFCCSNTDITIPDDVLEFKYHFKGKHDHTQYGPWEKWMYHPNRIFTSHGFHHPLGAGKPPGLRWSRKNGIHISTMELTEDWARFEKPFEEFLSGRALFPNLSALYEAREKYNQRDLEEPTPQKDDMLLRIDDHDVTNCSSIEEIAALMDGDNYSRDFIFHFRRTFRSKWLRERKIDKEKIKGCAFLMQRGICSHN
jgi:hypothetical protein